MGYVPGDHKAICDRCGREYRSHEVVKTWDNLIACKRGCWEPRHPQDLIRVVPDKPTVVDARPDESFVLGMTNVKVQGVLDDMTIDVDSISNILDGDAIGIELNTGELHWTYVNGTPSVDTVTLGTCLPGTADVGNEVYLGGIVGTATVA